MSGCPGCLSTCGGRTHLHCAVVRLTRPTTLMCGGGLPGPGGWEAVFLLTRFSRVTLPPFPMKVSWVPSSGSRGGRPLRLKFPVVCPLNPCVWGEPQLALVFAPLGTGGWGRTAWLWVLRPPGWRGALVSGGPRLWTWEVWWLPSGCISTLGGLFLAAVCPQEDPPHSPFLPLPNTPHPLGTQSSLPFLTSDFLGGS